MAIFPRQLVDIYLPPDEYVVLLIITPREYEWLSNKWHKFNPTSYRIAIIRDRLQTLANINLSHRRVNKLPEFLSPSHPFAIWFFLYPLPLTLLPLSFFLSEKAPAAL